MKLNNIFSVILCAALISVSTGCASEGWADRLSAQYAALRKKVQDMFFAQPLEKKSVIDPFYGRSCVTKFDIELINVLKDELAVLNIPQEERDRFSDTQRFVRFSRDFYPKVFLRDVINVMEGVDKAIRLQAEIDRLHACAQKLGVSELTKKQIVHVLKSLISPDRRRQSLELYYEDCAQNFSEQKNSNCSEIEAFFKGFVEDNKPVFRNMDTILFMLDKVCC